MLVRIKSSDELRQGDRIRYRNGKGFFVQDKDGARMESMGAEYDAEVIQITEHCVILRMTVDQSTIRRACVWEARPYNWAVTKRDIDMGLEQLYWERYWR